MKKTIATLFCIIMLLSLPLTNTVAFCSSVNYGDADGDGFVSAADARIVLRISVGEKTEREINLKQIDMNFDGKITASDARDVLLLSLGLIPENAFRKLPENAEVIGISSKHYPIYKIDGLTYIDGILLANKSYSLPENYNPEKLSDECVNAFNRMQKDAKRQGLNIYISSGFRSYSYQKNLYNRYVQKDGKALADTYSARAGHSEHQTGLAFDLNTITRSFAYTPEGKWVARHCDEYGFILRYPENSTQYTGYCYEPWHLRYVGVQKAKEIMSSGTCLEEYYGISSQYG